MTSSLSDKKKITSIHWFRHGLRLHDNPSLCEGLLSPEGKDVELYPIFIFDGKVAGTSSAGFNRMRFLHESLTDLDEAFRELGGRLCVFQGQPEEILDCLITEWDVTRITFEQDPEPIWQERDAKVKKLCERRGIEWIEVVSHNLWDPKSIIEENGGFPPVTYAEFQLASSAIGLPPRPVDTPSFDGVKFPILGTEEYKERFGLPSLEALGYQPEHPSQMKRINEWKGGESVALEHLRTRMKLERRAFQDGYAMPNHVRPNLTGPPMSMSAHLRFGCLSIRRFYWSIRDSYCKVKKTDNPPNEITCQLLWREYFYTMSVGNPYYNQMKDNPICLQIPWARDEKLLSKFESGQTGFPWIDACVQQLIQEGWIHHAARHAVACFLTRGDLWLSWEDGLRMFDKFLLDADWSVCAGNWMWVSSSAFEKVLQCPRCFCPVNYGRKLDPKGEYIRRYLPVLRNIPTPYLFEPWKAPLAVQKRSNCIIGHDYPEPCVDHAEASRDNRRRMEEVKQELIRRALDQERHCRPTCSSEIEAFVWVPPSDRLSLRSDRCHSHTVEEHSETGFS